MIISLISHSQGVTSSKVMLSFFSKAPLEDIYAKSERGFSAIDLDSKSIYLKVPIWSFTFKKA